jgi:5-(carboxyamino)imidazole ribonucleotide mutase
MEAASSPALTAPARPIVQMPAGVPVGTLAIGRAGAVNAGLLAASILATNDDRLSERVERYREEQTQAVAEAPE